MMIPMLCIEINAKLTTCLCFVTLLQSDIDLHKRHMLDLNLQPVTGLEQDVKGRSAEYVDVTCNLITDTKTDPSLMSA